MNLMAANITAGGGQSAADLLRHNLKSGYLLGATPAAKQFLAQFAGIFVGTVVTVLAFHSSCPPTSVLGLRTSFPAPAAQTWKAVAVALCARPRRRSGPSRCGRS